MSLVADSFKPPCLLGYYPCISNPHRKTVLLWILVLRTCFSASLQNWRLLTEPIFHVSSIVLQIGIVRMAAALVLGAELLSVDVLEAGNNDSKRRQFNKREN